MGKNNRTIFEHLKIDEKKLNIFIPLDNESVKLLSDFNIFGLPYSIYGDNEFASTVKSGNIFCPSPFFLYIINNRMLCHIVKNQTNDSDFKDCVDKKIYNNSIDPMVVGIWELKEGKVYNVLTRSENGLINENTYDNYMHNIMAEFSTILAFYNN